MDIDERLETLAERREALAQSVELLRDSMYEAAREHGRNPVYKEAE